MYHAFIGKPKMFFIQSCRGKSIQDTFVQPDDDEDDTLERISAPTDADILIAYATTEGTTLLHNYIFCCYYSAIKSKSVNITRM